MRLTMSNPTVQYERRKLESRRQAGESKGLLIRPKRPMIDANTSTTRIRTKRVGSAASESAAVAPVIPTATPQRRLHTPTVRPPQNNEKPEN